MAVIQLQQQELITRLGLSGDLEHLEEALTHRSFANEQRKEIHRDNQRLEFLGDSVLGLCVTDVLMVRYPNANEGELSRMRSVLVNAEALCSWARSVDLGAALRMGRGALATGEHERLNVLADAAEAVMGAVYLDRGLEEARRLVHAVIDAPMSRLGESMGAHDPKSALQERVQAAGSASPRYRTTRIEGPPHDREFFVVVEIDATILAEGRGKSKKLAEVDAARAALVNPWPADGTGTTPMSLDANEPPKEQQTSASP
jgi:ribonuclease III